MPSSTTSGSIVSPGHRLKLIAGALLFATSLGVAVWSVHRATTYPSVLAATPLSPFADPAENDRRLRDVVGTFATGNTPGDHVLVIQADGQIRFQRSPTPQPKVDLVDRFRLGQRDGHIAIATAKSGVIDVLDIDRLSYFDDVYERTKP